MQIPALWQDKGNYVKFPQPCMEKRGKQAFTSLVFSDLQMHLSCVSHTDFSDFHYSSDSMAVSSTVSSRYG